MGNLDGALVWEVVSAGHDLKVKIGDGLGGVEDLLEGEKKGLVRRNKQNWKASRKTVEVLRGLHAWAVATNRESLGHLVRAAFNGAGVRERFCEHAGGKGIAYRRVPELHVLVRVGLEASFLARLPAVLLEQCVPSQRHSVDALNLLERSKDALQEDDRVKEIREVVRGLRQRGTAKGVADTDELLPRQTRKVEVKGARGLDRGRGGSRGHEAADELENVTSQIVAVDAAIAELER